MKHVEQNVCGNYYSLLSAFLLSAFSIEAYANYVGAKVEKEWKHFEKSSTQAKIHHICAILNVSSDTSCRPFQSVGELFRFRNRIAHPKDEDLVVTYESTIEDYEKEFYTEPRPKFFEFATEVNARKCYEDVGAVMERINCALPDPDPIPPTSLESWSGSASIDEITQQDGARNGE